MVNNPYIKNLGNLHFLVDKKQTIISTTPVLNRQERHNEGTLTALIMTNNRSYNKMAIPVNTRQPKHACALTSNDATGTACWHNLFFYVNVCELTE